jgi:type IV pilus assembly protein PilA
MFCARCGAANPDNNAFCVNCGSSLQTQGPLPARPGMPGPPYAGTPETDGKAIASLICGLAFFIFPSAVAAIILGHLSISEINHSGGRKGGRGLAMTGLVLGYGGVLLIPFILIVAAIAIPNLLRSRMAANEASAVGSVRVIETAAITYNANYFNGFPPSLEALGGESNQPASCDHAQLIDQRLASGQKNGYDFSYDATYASGAVIAKPRAAGAAKGCSMAGGVGYEIHADPITRGSTGQRSFFADETGVIRYETTDSATGQSTRLGD